MNNLSIHNIKNISITLPKVMNKGIEKLGKEYTHRELEIETEEGIFRVSLFGNTIEDIKMHMEL